MDLGMDLRSSEADDCGYFFLLIEIKCLPQINNNSVILQDIFEQM